MMKSFPTNNYSTPIAARRGSTLVIVIALLGLLAFTGMVFYTFAAQERAASENFSEAAKSAIDEPPSIFDHMLRQVISGPGDQPSERASILRSTTRRHSMVNNLVGNDVQPYTGEGVEVRYGGSGLPVVIVDLNGDGVPDAPGTTDWLEFVDSPAARVHVSYRERGQEQPPVPNPPGPDIDYTYPDINNLFLAYKGLAIRDNGPGTPPGSARYEQVPVIIPSFFRPQYLKSSTTNGPGGNAVPTDSNWASAFDGTNRPTAPYPARTFRPHPLHIAGLLPNGNPVYRFLTDAEAAGLGVSSGGFPFVPADNPVGQPGGNNGIRGELGIWTGSDPLAYELDSDNDGDGIKEGIWMDLNYPVQETSTGQLYVILHSVTVYDLDALVDVNVHGNLAGLSRIGNFQSNAAGLVRDGLMSTQFLSRSNLGLGPNEINPLWALRRGVPPAAHVSLPQFTAHFNRTPSNDLEQANMEWFWMLMGRGRFVSGATIDNLYAGRWGETERLFNAIRLGSGTFRVEDLPRPGRSGNAQQVSSAGIRFGGDYLGNGRNGFDDNQDRYEGEADTSQGRLRAFGHPMDYAGTGRSYDGTWSGYNGTNFVTITGSPRLPLLHHDLSSTGPERWLGYNGYAVNRAMTTAQPRYLFGQNEAFDQATGDDLIADPFYDALFEDPLETIFDVDFAQRQFDQIFGPQDLLALHLTPADKSSSPDDISTRLTDLAPYAFEDVSNNTVREKFTTLSNSLRRFMLKHDLGADLQFGTADDGARAWEFTADSDGADRNNDGYADGDGRLEFPPAFGVAAASGLPYSATDPFRPQVRRLMTVEAGETRQLTGQLPLSINHILDVERNAQTPDEQAQPTQFLYYMQRAGLRFRPLTEHPDAVTEGNPVLTATAVPNYNPATPVLFPPTTPEDREYWARRDRQKLARDIFVLLYTTGGAQGDGGTGIRDYRLANAPSSPEGTALYTHAQLRQMAQLAVNLVDAMDTDNVITKFEYDKNLGDGWNLDDDPFTVEGAVTLETDPNFSVITDSGRFREDSETRGVVYGVEAQQFAFSEVLGIQAGNGTTPSMDHPATMHPDDTGRTHLFVELQNMQPTPNELATSVSTDMNRAIWRIVRYDRTDINDPIGGLSAGGRPFRSMAFRNDPTLDLRVEGGQSYTIATASTSDVVCSDFFVDFDINGTFDLIAPNKVGPPLPTTATNTADSNAPELKPRCDLDLIHPDHNLGFVMEDEAGNTTTVLGDFLTLPQAYAGNQPMVDLQSGNFNPGAGLGFDLVLQRRANPNMPSLIHGLVPGEDPNPWVDVDYIRVEIKDMGIQDGDTATELQNNRLPQLLSAERREPLHDGSRADYSGTPPNFRYNTIGITNSTVTPAGFQLWQPHFDRDYASPGELLNLPLFSPGLLTQMLDRGRFAPYQQSFDSPTTPTIPPKPRLLSSAAAKFLQPDFPDDPGETLQVNRARDNRWYRLLQFVEVPSRVHRMLGNYVSLDRVPGKLNLNTIRHWEVYAGLIDNPILLDREPDPVTTGRFTSDRTPSSQIRDRWVEYLTARDGGYLLSYDPAAGTGKQFLIPGTPNARPFRSPGFRAQGTNDDGSPATIFRKLAADVALGNPEINRNWLELGDAAQHMNPGTTNTVHQHQLLSKIMNNSTTVSNTFIIYSTAAYFEAIEDPPGSGFIRVGGRIDLDVPDNANPGWQQRAAFVIDRTEAFHAYDPGSGDFDWKRLIKHRVTIE